MIQINLLPDVKQEFIRAKRTRNTVISISIIAGLAALGLVVVMLLLLSAQILRDKSASKSIEEKYAQLESVEDLPELVTLQAQLENIGNQHKSKTMSSRLFGILQASNPAESDLQVKFSSVSLTPADQTLVLEGSTENGYRAVEAMAKTVMNTKIKFERDGGKNEEDLASSVEVGESSLRDDGGKGKDVTFSVRIVVNPALFDSQVKNLEIIAPSGKVDVTDSRIGVPESLFTSVIMEGDDE